jgi:hypothetical protein
MPWDSGGVGIHGSVFQDPIDSTWKAYLVCTPADFAPQEGRPCGALSSLMAFRSDVCADLFRGGTRGW